MSAGTLPADAFGLALEAANGTYADGTPLTFGDAIGRALLAAAGPIREQERERIAADIGHRALSAVPGIQRDAWLAAAALARGQERSDEKKPARPWPYDGPEGRARLTGNLCTEE